MLLEKGENTRKHTCEKGWCLCAAENFLMNSPKKFKNSRRYDIIRAVDSHILSDFPDNHCQLVDFEPSGVTSCEHGRLGDLFNGRLRSERRCFHCKRSGVPRRGRHRI